MSASADEPRAVVVWRAGRAPIAVAVEQTIACDVELVDRILCLALLARRVGASICLEDVDDDLQELLDFVGVTAFVQP